jgi:predicted transcriptional regulator
MGRVSRINAAGGFLKAVGDRRGQSQSVGQEASELPLTKVIAALMPTTRSGTLQVDQLAAETGLSRLLIGEVLANLTELGLVTISGASGSEQVALTDTGRVVAAKQDELHNT